MRFSKPDTYRCIVVFGGSMLASSETPQASNRGDDHYFSALGGSVMRRIISQNGADAEAGVAVLWRIGLGLFGLAFLPSMAGSESSLAFANSHLSKVSKPKLGRFLQRV